MVPKGWKSVYLNDISEKIMVGIASAATHAYCDDGIRMLRNLNIKDGWIDDSDILFVNEEYEKQHKNKRLKTGDILTVRTGYPGVSAVVPEKYNNAQCFTSLITRLNTSNALPAYICRFINSEYGKKYITSGEAGGAQKNVNAAILKKMRIPLPPLLEQQKIGNILSTWDKAISITERLIENSTQQKSALMQQLLTGKKRLLDESGNRFEGEWEEYKLGEITDFIRDGTHGTHKRYESGVPMLSAKNITKENTVDFDDAPYISEEDYNKIHARYTIKSGDILLTVVGTLGRVALVPEELAEKFTLQRSVAIIRVAKGVCNQFLMQLFSSSDFTHLLHRKSNSTAQAGVYLGELGKLKILLPSFEEQQKIATVLTNADKEIELLEQQLADLQQEKKALMQVLLTGKVRVLVNGEVA